MHILAPWQHHQRLPTLRSQRHVPRKQRTKYQHGQRWHRSTKRKQEIKKCNKKSKQQQHKKHKYVIKLAIKKGSNEINKDNEIIQVTFALSPPLYNKNNHCLWWYSSGSGFLIGLLLFVCVQFVFYHPKVIQNPKIDLNQI